MTLGRVHRPGAHPTRAVLRPRRRVGRGVSPVALSGTPGTGKTSVARALRPPFRSVEVGELALHTSTGRAIPGGVEVDLDRLSALVRRRSVVAGVDLVVGHVAHLLPLRDVVLLRCHPTELVRRLARSGRGSARERHENATAEALDVVLVEAIRPGRRIWEVDTTGLGVGEVAREVARRLRRRGPPEYGAVDWLRDPRVTDGLLDRGR